MEDDMHSVEETFGAIEQALQRGYPVESLIDVLMQTSSVRAAKDTHVADTLSQEYALQHDVDVLLTGDITSRTIAQLKGGRPLWLGLASQCVAVGIVSEEVGIAGAHFLTSTPEDIRNSWRKLLTSGKENAIAEIQRTKQGGIDYIWETIVPLENRAKRITNAIDAAANRYADIERQAKRVTLRPWVCITGVNYGTPQDKDFLKHHAEDQLRRKLRNPAMQVLIGNVGGVVYGGPHNPKFSTPQIIGVR